MRLHVMTANLWGLPWPFSTDRVGRGARFAAFLARISPDIVGLQEVWWPWRSRLRVVPLHTPRSWRDAGLALSGRLTHESRVALEPFRNHRSTDRLKRKGLLHSAIRAAGVDVQVIVTHFQAGRRHRAVRLQQAEALVALVERITAPVICMGDFNFYEGNDTEAEERLGGAGLRDAALAVGNASPTFWSPDETERFDRIYVRDGASASVAIQAVRVLGDEHHQWSDHAPLSAMVEVGG
jgi:endonuclease/exonuclease/phosphatase family metal-dependent hydrolase